MIIWNANSKKHDVRINGNNLFEVKSSQIKTSKLSTSDLETEIITSANSELSLENYHLYIHIFSKDPINYSIWLGSATEEPETNWWEKT